MPHHNSHSRGSSPLKSCNAQQSPYRFPNNMDTVNAPTAKNPALCRNQSVCEPNHAGKKGLRRTKSFTLSDNNASQPPLQRQQPPLPHQDPRPPLRFYVDDAIHELFSRKERGARSRGGPFGIISSLFACWHPRKPSDTRLSASKRVVELLEVSRRQQSELADKQDTIDMLEWQLEQMQALAFMEKEQIEPSRRSTASAINGLAVLQPTNGGGEDVALKECIKKNIEEKENKQNHHGSHEGHSLPASKVASNNAGAKCEENPDNERNMATLLLFEMATMRARFSIRSFSKALIKQMEASGYSVLRTLSELEPNVVFTRKEHAVYTLESRINKAFFHCFENDSYDDSGLMQILDPRARCTARLEEFQKMKLIEVDDAVNSNHPSFDAEFRRFCERKTRELWSQFSWSIVFNSREERDVFTAAFLDAAKSVWLLHRLAFSLNPHVLILRVGKGMDIDPLYVEAVPNLSPEGICRKCSKHKVEFLIMPGFRAMDKVIKCQVYQHVHCSEDR